MPPGGNSKVKEPCPLPCLASNKLISIFNILNHEFVYYMWIRFAIWIYLLWPWWFVFNNCTPRRITTSHFISLRSRKWLDRWHYLLHVPKVELIVNPSDEVIPRLRSDYGIERLDFVFMDHWKKCYSPDLQVTIKCHTKQGFSSVNEKT